jgi:uncharacterized protein (TIGR02996 family)
VSKLKADKLLAAVLDDPEDQAARQVYADFLLEKGEDRSDPVALRKSWKTWLDELAPVVMQPGLVFEGGLLTACQVDRKPKKALASVIGKPGWATVRSIYFKNYSAGEIDTEPGDEHPMLALLRHPVMRSLREVIAVGAEDVLAPLAASPKPSPLTSVFAMIYGELSDEAAKLIGACKGLPHLTRLGFDGELDLEWLLGTKVMGRLSELCLNGWPLAKTVKTVEKQAKKLPLLELRHPWVVENGYDRPHWIYRFRRGKRGKLSRLEVLAQYPTRKLALPDEDALEEQLDELSGMEEIIRPPKPEPKKKSAKRGR